MLFAVASAGCAASYSLLQLIAARAIQGIGAALLIPQGLSILSASFPEQERGRAIGTWSAWITVFAAIGPVVGGWLMQAWSWRLIFLLNLPLVLVILFLAPRIPESRALDEGPAQPSGPAWRHPGHAELSGHHLRPLLRAATGLAKPPGHLALTQRPRPLRLISALPIEPAQCDDAACALPHPPLPGAKPAYFSVVRSLGRARSM